MAAATAATEEAKKESSTTGDSLGCVQKGLPLAAVAEGAPTARAFTLAALFPVDGSGLSDVPLACGGTRDAPESVSNAPVTGQTRGA
jgi:hypothetical protein